MEDFLEIELLKRREMLEKIIAEKEAALKLKGPEGHVRCVQRGSRAEYYWRKDTDNTTGTYLSTTSLGTAEFLAQRTYDKAILKYAKGELNRIISLLKHHQSHNIDRIYEGYCPARQNLVNPISMTDDEYIASFLSTEYAENTYRLEDKIHESKLGVKMRSKSEVLIANIFTDLGAPYLYEFPVNLGYYGVRLSDFIVLNVRLRKVFYCEHFGMMDNADYCAKSLEKIHAYEKSGYFPGSDLIIFHETSSKPLDTQLVRSIAEHYLL